MLDVKEKFWKGKALTYSTKFYPPDEIFSAGEVKVIDYQTQQWRLFPQLSKAFAFLFAGNYVRDLYYAVFKNVGAEQVSVE